MICTGCFREFREEEKAYATVFGSIELNPFLNDESLGFYMSDTEPWLSILCQECGLSVHNYIAEKLQAKHL